MFGVRAVTFDFWSTLYAPRDCGQLEAMRDQRPVVLSDVLTDAGLSLSPDAVATAYEPPSEFAGPAASQRDTIDRMCERLGITPPSEVQRRLMRALDELAGNIQWTRAPGAAAVLRHLRQNNYRLGLVANVDFPSGRVIRQVLAAHGTLMYFQAFAFSDEVGVYKPDPAIFRHALYHLDLDTEPHAVVHVGDDPDTDLAGARATGMRTVRYAGFRDHAGSPDADAIIYNFRDLPDLIHSWQ